MSRTRRILALSVVLALSTQAASAILKKGSRGRVAGLAVSILDQIPNGAGKDVDIRVDMTTVQTEFLPRPTTTRGGPGDVLDAFTDNEISNRRYGFGGLGDADLRSTISASDTQGRDFTGFFNPPTAMNTRAFSSFYYGEALELTFRRSEFIEGEQPALDYGDGMTVDVETLQPFGSPTTSTTGPRRFIRSRWRGTFTHTYADLGSYTVTAASRCCPMEQNLGDDDTVERAGPAFTASPGYLVYPNSPSQLQFSYTRYQRLQFQSAYASPFSPTFSTNRGPASPQTGTFTDTFSNAGTGTSFAIQVTNTAQVEDGLGTAFAIEIPTAGAYGLGLLSLLLAAGGVVALRR